MEIRTTAKFDAAYARLTRFQCDAVDAALELFAENPCDPALQNHALTGVLTGHRALSAAPDLRLIFRVKGNYAEVLFLAVGGHAEVYRR